MEGRLEVGAGVTLHYAVDDYTDPWRTAPTVLMVHGFAESTEAWRAWVPYLARAYRVVRLDLRGFGRSTPMPEDYPWAMDVLLDDIVRMIVHLGGGPVHVVGAKSGGSIALQLAASRPDLVASVVGVTPPVVSAGAVGDWLREIEEEGVVAWARSTMPARLGSRASAAELEWWVRHVQGRTPRSTLVGYLRWVPGLDLREAVTKIACPALIITTTGSGLRTVDSVRAWQSRMPRSELLVIEGDAWHAAGAYPDACAQAARGFLDRIVAQPAENKQVVVY